MSHAPLVIRIATIADCPTILDFIEQLAAYEKLSHEVVATCSALEKTLFGEKPSAEVLIAEYATQPVGFALYFTNYSTFLAKPGICLYSQKCAAKALANSCSHHLPKSPLSATAAGWNGRYSIGTNPPSISIAHSGQCLWMAGQSIVSPATRCKMSLTTRIKLSLRRPI
jgi:hypothetical protein